MGRPAFWIDVMHVSLGYISLYMQYVHGSNYLASKIILVLVVNVCLVKTFQYLKIFASYSVIVTMLTNVFSDLTVFLTFYMILMLFLSQVFIVIIPATEKNLAAEYKEIGFFLGGFIKTIRTSLGDFDFSDLEHI